MIQVRFIPTAGSERELAKAALLSVVSDHSNESQAVFSSAFTIARELCLPKESRLISPINEDKLGGIDFNGIRIRKGSLKSIENWLKQCGASPSALVQTIVAEIEERGHQAFVIADHQRELGVIELIPESSCENVRPGLFSSPTGKQDVNYGLPSTELPRSARI